MGFPQNIRILVVDDMATMRKIVKGLLAQLGYPNVEEAENGKEAFLSLSKVSTI